MIKLGTLFSGIGAVEQAFRQLNIPHEIVFACDNGERYLDINPVEVLDKILDKSNGHVNDYVTKLYDATGKVNKVKQSYFANYSIVDNKWYEDIRFLNGNPYRGHVDLIVGGSPCQSFSTYGRKMGLEDTRGTLFYDYARIIKEASPKAFIFENVTGLLNHNKGETWKVINQVFKDLDYDIQPSVLDAQNYNLPQMRKRLFIVGIRKDIYHLPFSFPKTIPLQNFANHYLEQEVDNKYYLSSKGFSYVTNPTRNEGRARVNRDITGCQTANQQFNWTGDFRVEQPKQIHLNDPRIFVGEYLGKPSVVRKLTPKECLNLMGFENFNIVVNDQTMYRQVGNSIAVPVLKEIIKELMKVVDL